MPDTFLIDYVRVWQRPGFGSIGCDPASHPTKDYIDSHPEAYQNQNNTLWSSAGYDWPVSHLVVSRYRNRQLVWVNAELMYRKTG